MNMEPQPEFELAPLFQAAGEALRQEQQALTQADTANGNHGDHMVEIFEIATQATREKRAAGLAEAMQYAGQLLARQAQNGSAQLYARGLELMAGELREHDVSLDDLMRFVQGSVSEAQNPAESEQASSAKAKSGEVLKALISGLAKWSRAESGQDLKESPLDMGVLFEFGMAYLQAKQRGGSRSAVLADAAATASPLSRVPYRYQSGKLAIQAMLEAMQKGN